MENSLLKKKSFVLCRHNVQSTSRPSPNDSSDVSNQEVDSTPNRRSPCDRQQTSSQLLELIFNELDVAEKRHPSKKFKCDPLLTFSLPSVNLSSGCNCKKTKCLKLYCECFASGGYCQPGCSCFECCNNVETQNIRAESICEIVERDPKAFNIRSSKENRDQFKGCNCKKSGCQKKYCDCYNFGLQCSEHCKCEGCRNCKEATLVKIEMKKHMSSII